MVCRVKIKSGKIKGYIVISSKKSNIIRIGE